MFMIKLILSRMKELYLLGCFRIKNRISSDGPFRSKSRNENVIESKYCGFRPHAGKRSPYNQRSKREFLGGFNSRKKSATHAVSRQEGNHA